MGVVLRRGCVSNKKNYEKGTMQKLFRMQSYIRCDDSATMAILKFFFFFCFCFPFFFLFFVLLHPSFSIRYTNTPNRSLVYVYIYNSTPFAT